MSNLIITDRSQDDAGYFRIGNITLDIPPEQIQCHKVINGNEVMPLRFPFALPIKTGQSRWDVTWSWKAIQDPSSDDPYRSWKQVQMLLAMFKAAPFVEVENEHIRQIVNPGSLTNGATPDDTMAFALRQLRIDTVPDIVDALQITMTMTLFNYRPYSANFQYDDGSGKPASSAINSPTFTQYLQNWIQNNLNSDPTQQPPNGQSVSSIDWQGQVPGSITLSCREYIASGLPHTLPPPAGNAPPSANNPATKLPGAAVQGKQSGFVDNVFITDISAANPQIGWWVKAVSIPESNGNYGAINHSTLTNTGKPSVAVGILQWVRAAALDAMKASDKLLGTSYIATALQGGYLLSSSRSSSSYTWSTKVFPNSQSSDAAVATFISWMITPPITGGMSKLQNDMATAWALLKLQANGGSVLKSWEAHRFGQGIVNNGQGDPQKDNTWFTKAVNNWKANPNRSQDFNPAQDNTPVAQPTPQAPSTSVTTGTDSNPKPNLSNTSTSPDTIPMTFMIRYLLANGWTYDYATESAAFLYKEHWLKMTDQDSVHGDQPGSSDVKNINPEHFVYPNQISVVFVNNIAQMPLASYQFPTYQHLGSVSTLVSIGILSTAEIEPAEDVYSEPDHSGLSFISSMTSLMEEQFQRLRTEWRRVNSIHRMQSFAVKNQVLNMLGIRGLLTKELTTETIPDSPNMVSAQYNAIQYENVYEEVDPDPFRFSGVPKQLSVEWLKILRDGTLNQFKNDGSLKALTNLSDAMQAAHNDIISLDGYKLLFDWLTTASPQPRNEAYLIPTPAVFQGSEQQLMMKILNENGNISVGGVLQLTEAGANEVNTLLGIGPIGTKQTATAQAKSAFTFSSKYPDIAAKIKTHSQLNYTDYFIIKYWVVQNSSLPDARLFISTAASIEQRMQMALNANPTTEKPIDQLFDEYVGYAYSNNVGGITNQMLRVMNAPTMKDRLTPPALVNSPGSVGGGNESHNCYRDLGIKALTLNGKDYTPAVYFYNDNKALTSLVQGQVEQAVASTVKSTEDFAQATPYPDKTNLIQSTTQNFSGNIAGILSTIKPSSYTMAKAFPTFRLFLMEDNSDRPFYAFDNFSSYATVLDMEIIRYRDKPDTAVIQISNLMHLLDQHLYDQTPQGRWEQRLRSNTEVALPGDEALTGNGGVGSVSVNTTLGGETYSLDNRFAQINPGGDQKFPLRYFALQTGSKIQVRMGFSNSPDSLVPVFTGQVTEIEGDEILSITAQSYMLELITPTPDDIRHDGFAVDSQINNTVNALVKAVRDAKNIPNLSRDLLSIAGNSAAYGGWSTVGGLTVGSILTTGGSTPDVMGAMLKVSTAKHFGAWQLGAPTDPYLKGFSWKTALASTVLLFSSSPLSRGATGLEAGYDRSFENILTSHVFGPDGSATIDTDGSARGWWYEKPGGYGSPEYHVPKDPTLTPWTLIQDIARRYPEFLLAVKQYGFPYTADATLVFANPHDFYTTRPPMPGEIEVKQQSKTDDRQFFNWWSSNATASGRAQFIAFCLTQGGQWSNIVLKQYDQANGITNDTAVSAAGQFATFASGLTESTGLSAITHAVGLQSMRDITASQLAAHIDAGGAGAFDSVIQTFVQVIGSASTSFLSGTGNDFGHTVSPFAAQSNLQQIVTNYTNFLKQKTTGSGANIALIDRMKPVRRYHFINADNIVHNGIMLNEKFYNTVQLMNQTLAVNSGIPSQHRRLLVADSFIVSPENLRGDVPIQHGYIQSFMRDELAKAYRGEIVLLGNPEIEPFDVLVMSDPSTGITGPIEVDSVIHSFNTETGYITIVRPRALTIVNDKLGAPTYQAVLQMLSDMQGVVNGYASKLPFAVDVPQAEAGLTVAAAAGALALSPWIAGAAVIVAPTIVFWTGKVMNRLNPMGFIPLTRFERPWVSGLEGWRIDDALGTLRTKWEYFKVQEIEPLIFSYRQARGMGII